MSRSDLAKALSLTAVVLEREWIDATARAAVRFAAGKATAGLVAPAVAGLTRSVLATMFLDSIRVLALFAIAALLAAAGLSWAAFRPVQVHVDRLPVESRALIATPQHSTEPTLGSSASEAPIAVVIQKPPSAPQAVSGSVRTPADAAATVIDEAALPTQTPIQMIPRFDRSDRSPGPPSGDRSLDTSLRLGRELFERAWVKGDPRTHGGDGLGPVFNGQSCVACHNLGGTGGAGPIDRNIEIATATEDLADYMGFSYSFSMDFGAGRFDYRIGSNPQGSSRRDSRADPRFLSAIHAGFQDVRSVVLHRFGTDPAYNACESVAGRHGSMAIRISERNPPPLFGLGRLDAIPDEAIEAAARRRFSGSAQQKGRVSRLNDGRIGRFGWKAQTATLDEFVLNAAAGEVGLELPGRHQAADPRLPGLASGGLDMSQEECNHLVAYVRKPSRSERQQAGRRERGGADQSRRGGLQGHRLHQLPLAEIGPGRRDLQRPFVARHGPPARRL